MIPAIVRLVDKYEGWVPRTFNVDIGGGPYELMTRALLRYHQVANVVWDPYNRPEKHNQTVVSAFNDMPADTATLSNVLNVLQDRHDRISALSKAKHWVKRGGKIYVTVYEGDRQGLTRRTRDGWQLNRTTASYLAEVGQVFEDYERRGKLIIIRRR